MRYQGRVWTRRELAARIGCLDQIGGVRRLRRTEGPEDGGEAILVRTGGGLSYQVTPHKGLDISLAEFAGVPLSWQASPGDVHPAYFDGSGSNWLRTASGGLLMTCGLTQVGRPGHDDGEDLGLHGRIHHTPARQVVAEGRWQGDEHHLRVAGVLEETSIFGHRLTLTREIRSQLGENRIELVDVVENHGFRPAPLQLLYHCNLGFPLLSESARIEVPEAPAARDPADHPIEDWRGWPGPQVGCAGQVTIHHPLPAGPVRARVVNPGFRLADGTPHPLRLELAWDGAELPCLVQWRLPGEGEHVLGLEPALGGIGGRAAARADGSLCLLAPGGRREFHLSISVGAA
jgi:hypothetical protein